MTTARVAAAERVVRAVLDVLSADYGHRNQHAAAADRRVADELIDAATALAHTAGTCPYCTTHAPVLNLPQRVDTPRGTA